MLMTRVKIKAHTWETWCLCGVSGTRRLYVLSADTSIRTVQSVSLSRTLSSCVFYAPFYPIGKRWFTATSVSWSARTLSRDIRTVHGKRQLHVPHSTHVTIFMTIYSYNCSPTLRKPFSYYYTATNQSQQCCRSRTNLFRDFFMTCLVKTFLYLLSR